MTATAAPTDQQCDGREVPGDGKRNPCNHIVRIVVVPANGSHDQDDDLTPKELEASEAFLQATGMLDVLKPTDIVVIRAKPASVRPTTSPSPGTQPSEAKPKKKVVDHDDHHRDTVLRVWTESDTIEYQCDREFEIVKVERAGWKIYGTPEDPFETKTAAAPYRATKDPTGTVWTWKSGVLPAAANNQQYKAAFLIGGKKIDPDVVCGDPPPAP
jgi:hypothetical protein